MERVHPRDVQSTGVHAAIEMITREAAAMDPTANTPATGSLLGRGARIARSLILTRKCVTNESINTCEKPVATTGTILGVLVGCGVAAFILILIVLYLLHLRRKRHDKAEFANDPHELSDYGLDEVPATKKGARAGGGNLGAPNVQQHRLSAQQLMEAQNPFSNGAELADSDRVVHEPKGSPPQYPGDAHVKM